MPDADGRRASRAVSRPSLSFALLLTVGLGGCAGGPPTVDLMPAPAVFADGAVDPLPKGAPPVTYDDFGIYYATDRKASDDPEQWPFYRNQTGFLVRMGQGRVKAGREGVDWQQARRVSLSSERRRGDYPLRLLSVDESNVLDSSYSLLTRAPPPAASDDTGREFADLIDQRLDDSGVKEIYIYVHGYRVVFDDPLIISSEFWHFLGYRGAFVAYAWPSTPRALAYLSDLETASAMARKLRLFLGYLAEHTQAEKIHIIAYSAGSRLVTGALDQLALLHADDPPEQIRKELRIGNVIFVGADISREEFGTALMDGMIDIPERIVVYMSSTDRALRWARRLFRRPRLGEMWGEPLAPRTMDFLRSKPSLEVVDVTGSAGSTTGNGHDYFRQSPWVSSDLLALLAFDMDAQSRGLEKKSDLLVWQFPPDYIERLRANILDRHPELSGHSTPADNNAADD